MKMKIQALYLTGTALLIGAAGVGDSITFDAVGSWTGAAILTVLMAGVSGVYYWRARTEEKHLSADPDYRAYAAWMALYGPVPRLINTLLGRKPARSDAAAPTL